MEPKVDETRFGTSHTLSLAEAEHVRQPGADWLKIGAGQTGTLVLSDEATDHFMRQHCRVDFPPTPQAIEAWNKVTGNGISLFFVAC